ncbi:MAG: hypothetical protein ABI444_05000 [Candidatus Kapaibacterium sp.]|jgi:hypothetical protein
MDLADQVEIHDAVYVERVVAYLDILGFEKMVDASATDGRFVRKIAEFVKWASELLGPPSRAALKAQFGDTRVLSQFSDSFAVSCDSTAEQILHLLECLQIAQIDAIGYGLTLRGGVCKGPLLHEHDNKGTVLLFGPAINRAHELENVPGSNPRIVIDDSLADEIGSMANPRFQGMLARDQSDRIRYINYLKIDPILERTIKIGFNEKGAHYHDFEEYKEAVETLVHKHIDDDSKIAKKYMWMQGELYR